MGNLKDSIVNELSSIDWASLGTSQWQDSAYEAVANSIYSYVSDTDTNATIVCTVTGVITPPTPPSPYSGSCTVDITYLSASVLKTSLLSSISTGSTVPGAGIPLFFSVLATWLAAPVATITGWDPSSIGTLSGAGVVTFPAMAAQGPLCQTDMLNTKPTSFEDSWSILEPYIVTGLSGTITVPAAAGVVGTASFAGSAAGTINYN